ncbi:hypothetical protein GQ457_15G018930 [Hibiscus cannabinus]
MGVIGARCTFQVCRCWYPRHCLGLQWHGVCQFLLHHWHLRWIHQPNCAFGLFLARKLSLTKAVFYIVMQCLSAICSARGHEGALAIEVRDVGWWSQHCET